MNNDYRIVLRVLAVVMRQQGLKQVSIDQREFESLEADISWAKSPDGREMIVKVEEIAE